MEIYLPVIFYRLTFETNFINFSRAPGGFENPSEFSIFNYLLYGRDQFPFSKKLLIVKTYRPSNAVFCQLFRIVTGESLAGIRTHNPAKLHFLQGSECFLAIFSLISICSVSKKFLF